MLFGATGPILRSTGCAYDLRFLKAEQYAAYNKLAFKMFVGIYGDCYDRFLIRSRELFESAYIVLQAVTILGVDFNGSCCLSKFYGVFSNQKVNQTKTKMENTINKFKYISDFITINSGISYKAVEAGKGEFGVMVVSSGDNKPYRAFLRSPAYNHLQLLSLIGSGCYFADLITLVGSLDLVFGEIDR